MIFNLIWIPLRNLLQPLFCFFCCPPLFIGCRKLVLVERITTQVDRVACPECGQHYAVHHGLQSVLKWDKDFDELYAELANIIKKHGNERKVEV